MSEPNYNYLFKFIIIGDSYVGKSNILSRYTFNKFNPEHEITIGCEFMAKTIKIKDRNIKVQVWDTAGQEAFRAITRAYYKNSACALIVYDITNRKSFQSIKSWLNECRDMCSKNVLIILIGNKSDLDGKRVISKDEGFKFAQENNLKFFETSALNGNNVEEVFLEASTELLNKLENREISYDSNSGVQIRNFPNKEIEELLGKKQKKCC